MRNRALIVSLVYLLTLSGLAIHAGFSRMEEQGYGRAETGVCVVKAQSGEADVHGDRSSGLRDRAATMIRCGDQGGAP